MYMCQVIILGATLAGTILWLHNFAITFFESPELIVQELTIDGNQRVSQNEIKLLAQIPFGTKIWMVNLEDMAKRLESHAWIKSCSIQRKPPQRIHISITERQPIVFCLNPEDSLLYGLDTDGTILPGLMGPTLLQKSEAEQEAEIAIVLSHPLLRGVEMKFEPGSNIHTDQGIKKQVVASLQFLDRLKNESPALFAEMVEAEWREDETFALHPRRRVGVVVMKDFSSLDIEKKLAALWQSLEKTDVQAIYIDARFPEKGFAVRFDGQEQENWQRLYQSQKTVLMTGLVEP
jgi:hypothetical protein